MDYQKQINDETLPEENQNKEDADLEKRVEKGVEKYIENFLDNVENNEIVQVMKEYTNIEPKEEETLSEISSLLDDLDGRSPTNIMKGGLSPTNQQKDELFGQKLKRKIFSLKQKLLEITIAQMKKNNQTLDSSSYFFTSMIFEPLLTFIFIFPFLLILMVTFLLAFFAYLILFPILIWLKTFKKIKKDIKTLLLFFWMFLKESYYYLITILILSILLLPCLLIVVTQLVCVSQLYNEEDTATVEGISDTIIMFQMKIAMIILFFCISIGEASSAWRTIIFFFSFWREENRKKRLFTKVVYFLKFICETIPQMIQILVTFMISYINVTVISGTELPIDLIQNFAGLAIILEFDNIVIVFLRHIGFYKIYKMVLSGIKKKKSKTNYESNLDLDLDYVEHIYQLKLKQVKSKLRKNSEELTTTEIGEIEKYKKKRENRYKKKKENKLLENSNNNKNNLYFFQYEKIAEKLVYEKLSIIKKTLSQDQYEIPNKYTLKEEKQRLWILIGLFFGVLGILIILMIFFFKES